MPQCAKITDRLYELTKDLSAEEFARARRSERRAVSGCPLTDVNRKSFARSEHYRWCDGFRTTAPLWAPRQAAGAVVRKPPGKEPAGDWARAAVPAMGII